MGPSPLKKRIQTFLHRVSSGSVGVDHREDPFADPADAQAIEDELTNFTKIVTALQNSMAYPNTADPRGEETTRHDLVTRGDKSKRKIKVLMGGGAVEQGLKDRFNSQKGIYRYNSQLFLQLQLRSSGII